MSTAAAIQPHHGLPRMLAGLSSGAGAMSLAEHHAAHGPLPVMSSSELIEAVQASGLRGRGGADFPTARKLLAVAARKRVSAVVVNGSETEPASRKDELLLSRLPHLVLDGAVLAAGAVGAPEVVVRLRDDAPAGHRGAAACHRPARRRPAGPPARQSGRVRQRRGNGGRPSPQRRAPRSRCSFPRDRSSAAIATVRRSSRTRRRSPSSPSWPDLARAGTGSSAPTPIPAPRW